MKIFYMLLLLSTFILFTESKLNSKRNTDILKSLLENDGWNNLKDVTCIEYFKKFYYSEIFLHEYDTSKTDKQIRLTTIYLTCSYVKDLKILYFIFKQFGQHCKSLINNRNPLKIAYNCALKLLNILQKLSLLATLMKETLYLLDYMHTNPLINKKRYNYLIDKTLLNIEKFNSDSKCFIPKENDSKSIKYFLNSIFYFFTVIDNDTIKHYKNYCKFVPFNIASLWHEWSNKYKYKINNDKTLQYDNYLCQKVDLRINSIIINKFYKLGFQYDQNIQQVGIPLPDEYCTDDLKLFTKPNKISETIQNESRTKESNIISGTNEEPQLIDFLGQGLNPDISEPMETDENREMYIKFL
ncbi:uncharacterized protein LOC126896518 isoform X1 [Daktulosphaira vitifoliae]|uniref:uncharacterized protein LOC126896518 isoform X1 n=1 Tax=Daktulosphaira vitifoliae TaxID=58002 RepID=UPI0021AA8593|nr:uncharacterized protein LOC126896518 isoform X1 [Daktulosphaira vitifoliae]